MHSDAFDRYHHHDSALHRLDPRIKVVVVIAFILSNALLPDGAWMAFVLAWLFLFLANALSDLGLGYTLRRSFIALPFALVAVTRFPDLIHAFEHLRVPAILTTIIAFLYRYLFVLTDEVMRLLRARQSRSAAAAGQRSGGGVLWRARVSGHMAGQLFLRSYERSDRIYNAMLARGYAGQLLTLNPHELHARDWAYAVVAFLFILAMQFVGRY